MATGALGGTARAGGFWERATAPDAASPSDASSELADTAARVAELVQQGTEYWQQSRVLFHDTDARSRPTYGQRQSLELARRSANLAVDHFEQALALDPNQAELHLLVGLLLYEHEYQYWDRTADNDRRDAVGARVVDHFDAFERLAPRHPWRLSFSLRQGSISTGPRGAGSVAYQFVRAIILTKVESAESWTRAVADYDFLLDLPGVANGIPREDIARNLTNSAEVLMALGRIDEAIERYEEGLARALDPQSKILYMYGLAVARDRAGFTATALTLMRDAMSRDEGEFKQLSNDTVFFIPHGDVQYYRGLGHEAAGRCELAALHFSEFLRQTRGVTLYAGRAKEHLAFIEAHQRDPKHCGIIPNKRKPMDSNGGMEEAGAVEQR